VFRRREFVLVLAHVIRASLRETHLSSGRCVVQPCDVRDRGARQASLGFLGLSVPPPAPSWGSIISNSANLDIARRT
jgi:hypothetical protein